MTLWTKIFGNRSRPDAASVQTLAPDTPFVAIGDIHGRLDLLETLLRQIDEHAPKLPLVFLGDYVDRGPDSAGVLTKLKALEHRSKRQIITLMGNHDMMMLDFIETPEQDGPRWLKYGGDQTLASFGITLADQPMTALRDQLLTQIDPGLLSWLCQRPLIWQSGNIIASHAGGNPNLPIDPNRGHSLLWGHPDIHTTARRDGLWMIHGHFAGDEAYIKNARICIDTRAHRSDQLTAAVISPKAVAFLST